MADTSALSDDELRAALSAMPPAPSGMSDDELRSALAATPAPQMQGTARAVAFPASNVAKGLVLTAGLPGDVVRGVGYLGGRNAEATLNPDPLTAAMTPSFQLAGAGTGGAPRPMQIVTPQMMADAPGRPNIAAPSLHNPFDSESLLGHTHDLGITDRPDLVPQTYGERLEAAGATGVGAALPSLVTGGATLPSLARTIARGAGGGVGGEVGGTAGDAIGGAPGRVVGTLAGAIAGGAPGATAGSVLRRGMDPETAALAQNAADRGINVSVGAASSSPFVRYVDAFMRRMPFSGYASHDAANQTAFMRNTAASFGEAADKITPDVINNAYSRMSNNYNGVASRTQIPTTPQFMSDLQGVVDNARLNMSAANVEPVQRQAMNILDTAANNQGVISGQQFKNLTSKGGAIDTLKGSSDSGLRQAGDQFDTILKQHLAANATPEDVALLQQTDRQYKALKTIEPLTMGATTPGGASPATGDINPVTLNGRVKQQYDYAPRTPTGQTDLVDLARIGQRFLKEPSSSGTAERLTIAKLGEMGGAALAPFAGEHLAGVPATATIPPLIAALLGPRMVGSVLRQPAIRPPLTPIGAALMAASPQLTGDSVPQLVPSPVGPRVAGPASNSSSRPQ